MISEAPINAETLSESTDPKRKKRTFAKKSGPACTERIIELRNNGFFDQMRKASEIKDGLAQNGHGYAGNQVGAALTSLYKTGELRRSKIDNVWQYQKP